METTNEKNTATLTHLSTLSQFFIPFGNYIFPIIIWSTNKEKSSFVSFHGKQSLNFQLSILLYSLLLCLIALPILIFAVVDSFPFTLNFDHSTFSFSNLHLENCSGLVIIGGVALLLLFILKATEFFLVLYASIKASNGEKYCYPLSIPFLK